MIQQPRLPQMHISTHTSALTHPAHRPRPHAQVDARDRLYLLWSSSVRLEDPKQFSVALDVGKAVKRNSLNIDAQLKLPRFIRCGQGEVIGGRGVGCVYVGEVIVEWSSFDSHEVTGCVCVACTQAR
jgi:hypothetical protein